MSRTTTQSQTSTAANPTLSGKRNVRVDELVHYIQNGRILEAMEEFYAPDVTMRENANAPTVGLSANIEREKQFLAGVKEWQSFDVLAKAATDDVSFVENRIRFIATNGAAVDIQQVSVARWRDGKIVEERFYYDSATK